MSRLLSLAMLCCLVCWSPSPADDAKGSEIFNGMDLTGWKVFIPAKDKSKAKPGDVWTVKDGVIECKGRPNGYIVTEKEYGDYVLELEWRWPAKPGNSGVLLHVSGKDMIWPKSAEAQLYAGSAGDIWLIENFKLDVDKSRQDKKTPRHYFRLDKDKKVEKEPGEWNKYRITCKGDTVRLEVNGVFVNEGKNSEFTKGKIALQAEGSPIHFRNIKLTPAK
ncbi:MAG: DUF1080 domain-containing protein [Gemmataceae bacterium]